MFLPFPTFGLSLEKLPSLDRWFFKWCETPFNFTDSFLKTGFLDSGASYQTIKAPKIMLNDLMHAYDFVKEAKLNHVKSSKILDSNKKVFFLRNPLINFMPKYYERILRNDGSNYYLTVSAYSIVFISQYNWYSNIVFNMASYLVEVEYSLAQNNSWDYWLDSDFLITKATSEHPDYPAFYSDFPAVRLAIKTSNDNIRLQNE